MNIEGDDAIRTEAQIRAAFLEASQRLFRDFTNEAGVVVEDDKLVIMRRLGRSVRVHGKKSQMPSKNPSFRRPR